MDKVLVLDCWTRKGLSVARALGTQGVEVHCCSHKSLSPARFSKHTKKFFLTPDPVSNTKVFIEKILKLLKKEKYACLIPLEDETISSLYPYKNEIVKHTVYILPTREKFELARDKWETLKLADKLSIPIPKSYCPKNERDLFLSIEKLGYPLIIKPKISSGSRGLRKINSKQELLENYPQIIKKYGFPILQEYLDSSGPAMIAAFIAKKGEVLVDFSYQRIREYPISGGPGTMWVSTDNKEIKNYGKKLIKALKWDGVIMVEFKFDKNEKTPKLMEINPRFWGSLHLATVSGVNFPYLLYLLSINKKFTKPRGSVGVECRWLIPGDVMHFITNPSRFDLKPSFFKFVNKNLFYEDFYKKDIPGSIGSLIFAASNLFDLDIWRKAIFRK